MDYFLFMSFIIWKLLIIYYFKVLDRVNGIKVKSELRTDYSFFYYILNLELTHIILRFLRVNDGLFPFLCQF